MDAMFLKIVEGAPTFIGLVVAVWILYRQTERLMNELFGRIDMLEARIDSLEMSRPPYPAEARVPLKVTKKGSEVLKGGHDGATTS